MVESRRTKVSKIILMEASGVSDDHMDKTIPVDVTLDGIPVVESESGWETIESYPITDMQGMGLKSVKYSGPPGSHFRIRSECVKGACYHATIWDAVSKGIPKTMPLVGHEFGGHEICTILLQKRVGHKGEASLDFQMYGEGFEDAPTSNV